MQKIITDGRTFAFDGAPHPGRVEALTAAIRRMLRKKHAQDASSSGKAAKRALTVAQARRQLEATRKGLERLPEPRKSTELAAKFWPAGPTGTAAKLWQS